MKANHFPDLLITNFYVLFSIFCFLSPPAFSQPAKLPATPPKLVVGIVVDQMRYDYIYRYWDKYSNDGFKKLMNDGYFCKNTNYNYAPTFTGPGHAAIYTGTTPAVNGIAANNWYSRDAGRPVYCSEDKSVQTVGSTSAAGLMSPKNLLTSTLCDQLKLASNMKSKVIGIAIKDRGAILTSGHSADAAYWFDDATGNWISSSYYMKDLPGWLQKFNAMKNYEVYLSQKWNTLLPIAQYSESIADRNPYESFGDSAGPVFPYNLPELRKNHGIGLLRNTPYGNSFTKDFALEAIKMENLGKNNATDFLALSFSSTDYVGHIFGPQSIEVEDTYLRLDRDIADLLKFLDGWVGKNNVLIFLTADHAAVENPAYLSDVKIPGGYIYFGKEIDTLKTYFFNTYRDSLIITYINQQVYLNHRVMAEKKLNKVEIENYIAEYFIKKSGVARVYTSTDLKSGCFELKHAQWIQNGWNVKRSGDVLLNFEPNYIEHERTGTTHGSPYSYDTHVPLFFYGWNIKPGSTVNEVNITDIAPTLSMLLNIQFPNGCTGKPISELFE